RRRRERCPSGSCPCQFSSEGGVPAAAAGGTLEQRQLIAAMDNGREVVLEQTGFFARDEARQHENGLARASFPNGDAFVGAGHAKPVRAGSLKGFGDLWPAVAVAVALDDGQDLARRLALLSRRIHVVANGCEVVRERTERNLGPDRPSCFTAGTFLFAWHVPSMEQRSEERRVGKECRCRWWEDQAEDGIRDGHVTGVQTCALPICCPASCPPSRHGGRPSPSAEPSTRSRSRSGRRRSRSVCRIRSPDGRGRRTVRGGSLRPRSPGGDRKSVV